MLTQGQPVCVIMVSTIITIVKTEKIINYTGTIYVELYLQDHIVFVCISYKYYN